MRSIRQTLTISLLSVGLLAGLTTATLAYLAAKDEAEELFDAQMAQMARLVEQLAPDDDSLPLVIMNEEEWIPAHPYEEQLSYRIVSNAGKVLIASPSFPEWIDQQPVDGYRDLDHPVENWRIFTLIGEQGQNHIQVVQSDKARTEIATKIALTNTLPILVFLPLLCLAIWWQIGRSLKPLVTLSEEVSERSSGHLNPVRLQEVPSEINGLVRALNRMLQRLKLSFERERRFTADAAHELRTPLAALQIHCENLFADLKDEQSRGSTEQILSGLKRMNRIVEQLLHLSRLDPQERLPDRAPLNLTELCRELIGDQIPFAIARRIDLGLTAPDEDLQASGHALYLSILLRNLVDNALRYTPQEGEVTLELEQLEGKIRVSVIDSGPGLSDEQKQRVFERFYRGRNKSDGSGLGLSIANQIAELHGSEIELLDRQDGKAGLVARFTLEG
ncbi:ATP-binding protein [Marinobacterium lutimaris]|uniref:histidine kinase n=1 Tax=Marinobacterium lutimaris TaxID=568106 RepID=A0A1H6AJ05_9GAMM|nr:ATP-binding protein [Marinobacterium lutimaris]SEG48067.1 two-component system, OmpR family, sensor histidine kinase QseC [Marinobacterium lutimaris]